MTSPHTLKMPAPPSFVMQSGERELLRITPDGQVIASDLEAASEAGQVFVDCLRAQLRGLLLGNLAESLERRADECRAHAEASSFPAACREYRAKEAAFREAVDLMKRDPR